jgi:outer membrane biosynthesis protein TonB
MMTAMVQTAERETLPVEIALLISLLLHAMAFGTWQYRTTLLKLPWLSSLAKWVQAAHVQPSAVHPPGQTITFVKLDEPRAQNQPNQGKQSQQFLETDASQVTAEKPKAAQYYSDKSTVAANQNNPSGKVADTPYLDGKEPKYKDRQAMSTVDVPTQSGVSAPLAVQAGRVAQPSPPATSKPAPTSPQEKPPVTPQPQPQSPAQPQEIPEVGLKIMEEQKVAMAPKPTATPNVVTGSDVPTPPAAAEAGEGGTPALASEPGVEGREIVARKAHLVAAGVSRAGVTAFNVEASPFGAYDKKVIKAIQSRWYQLIDRYGIYESTATVTVYFELNDDGQVKNVKTIEGTENSILSLFCEKAIIESGPFDPWPDDLRALAGKEPRQATFTFYY